MSRKSRKIPEKMNQAERLSEARAKSVGFVVPSVFVIVLINVCDEL